MRVVYDISVLGQGHASPGYRTGLFRAVESVARGLADSGACELAFSALHSDRTALDASEYLRTAAFPGEPALVPPHAAHGAVEGMIRAYRSLMRRTGAPLAARVARRLLRHAIPLAETALGMAAPVHVPPCDVFHSPRFPLPRRGRTGRAARVLTVYDLIPLRLPRLYPGSIIAEMERIVRSLRPDDWALVISDWTRADLCEHRPDLDPSRVSVTHLAADPALFHRVEDAEKVAEVRARYGIPAGPYLLSLNTADPRKNMGRALAAFARAVEAERVPHSFVLVGYRSAALERLLEQGAARGRVHLAGYVADGDLAALYSGATAFVFPSLYEGFGLPPLEAMRCGVPVIASSTTSLPEVVGDAGILVDPADTDALADAIARVCRDDGLRQCLREKALLRAAAFSWERSVAQTLAAYRAALGG
ncbi:MAG TPA: glycosyltransferase family 1 protein [Longimicrobium sp.]|jgi:glycosyltransferase involved in cell wall biosynthesis